MKLLHLLIITILFFFFSSCKKDSSPDIIPAQYTVSYKVIHDGKYFIEIPKTYEFANILLATKDLESPSTFIQNEIAYYQRVYDHFFPFRFNDIFYQYNFDKNEVDSYFSVSLNSYKYEYYHGQMESKDIYNTIWNPDIFSPQLPLITNLYIQSDFETFYRENESYYLEQIQLYDSIVPIQKIWNWLESQFSTQINSYIFLISPLSENPPYSTSYFTAEYNESLLFLSGFHKEIEVLDTITTARLIQEAFVEMDAEYIKSASDQYASKIATSMSRRVIWKDNLEINQDIDTPLKVFNEYMKWATYCLFVKENHSSGYVETIITNVEDYMVNKMGYIRYKEFNNKLMSLYTGNGIEHLYPELLQWADEVNDN